MKITLKINILSILFLANCLFAQNTNLNDSVVMGLKLPSNNDHIKVILDNLVSQVNTTKCWVVIGGKYKWNPKLKMFDNRMEFTNNGSPLKTIYLANIINNISYEIGPSYGVNYDYIWIDYNTGVCFKKNCGNIFYTNLIAIKDTLKRAQKAYKETIMNNELVKFKNKSSEYLAQSTNPTISEEQRKYIVQANAANEQKNYKIALELYEKTMQLNEFNYPQGYYNMALIASQLEDYTLAIFNMKKYLLISPNAEDSRKAQDKIYEWELNIKK